MHAALLSKGFLPRELPQLFSSASLGNLVGKTGLPADFVSTTAVWTQPVQHNLARAGGLRRKLSIPNPVNYFRLAKAFDTNSGALVAQWGLSPYSQTTPDAACSGPRAIARNVSDRASPRAKTRVGARYLLRTDIAQFYPSIYTHAVPWSLHSKAVAKKSMKDMSLAGNVLDRELQASQFGQTKGVPIGPDTSLGIAEILLAPLDLHLKNTCPIVGGTRFIDDIEFTFKRLSEAETALARMEYFLNELELQLNQTKTHIDELPSEIESDYVTSLRPYVPTSGTSSKAQWIDYFNQAFGAARAKPQAGVLRYAVAALQGVQVNPKLWELVQQLLWQCITSDAGCLRFVTDILLSNKAAGGHSIDLDLGASAVESLIQNSAPIGHGSEVVWSIWAAIHLKLPISSASQALIATMDDAVVAVTAMVAHEEKVFESDFDSTLWKSWITPDSFKEEYWLFIYECVKRGWFTAEVTAAGLPTNANVMYLLANSISFVDIDAIHLYTPARRPVLPTGSGGGY